jgi:quinol monooxygenase YgiN
MIIRIVKMTFVTEKREEFVKVFNASKELIRNFEGCKHLKLLNDQNNPSIFFTYSIWGSEINLERYRNSELFKTTWAKTKILFSDKPKAWSTQALAELS